MTDWRDFLAFKKERQRVEQKDVRAAAKQFVEEFDKEVEEHGLPLNFALRNSLSDLRAALEAPE